MTITDKEVLGKNLIFKGDYSLRTAVRAIVFNSENKVAVLHAKKYHFHKLPGGGVEEGENIKKALRRELKEELGCIVKIIGEVGKIIEIKNQYGQKQTSLCYVAKVINQTEPNLTKEEREDLEIEITWVSPEAAVKLFKKDKPSDYTAKFITKRDFILLNEFLKEK